MRVGVDTRCLTKEITGIGYYTVNVVNQLDKSGIRTVLFSPSPLHIDMSHLKNCSIVCKSFRKVIAKQIWFELYLPFILKKFDIDLFWGPSHRIPLRVPNNVATVVTIHDLVWKRSPQTMRKSTLLLESIFMPRSVNKADFIISDTESTTADLQQFFSATDYKIRQVPLAPRLLTTKMERPKVEKSNREYILFIGTIEPRKNLNRLITAYSKLPQTIKDRFGLIIVGGNGWGSVNPREQIAKLGLQNNILLKSYTSDMELTELYRQAYCLTMPSLYEGFGLPILEAQSFGVPVVTSNVSSMPEVAGEGAILVDPYSIENIRSGLEKLLSNEVLRRTLSIKAKENTAKYSWDKTAQLTIDVFKEAIQLKTGFANDRCD